MVSHPQSPSYLQICQFVQDLCRDFPHFCLGHLACPLLSVKCFAYGIFSCCNLDALVVKVADLSHFILINNQCHKVVATLHIKVVEGDFEVLLDPNFSKMHLYFCADLHV